MLDVSRLQAGYGRARVVHDFSLSVGPGEVLGLVGRNGVGKTTSLKAIQVAGSLSGGERKLLAFARIMLLTPSIYLIDEPTEGLMPKAVDEIGHLIATIARDGAAVVVVEQNLALVRAVATRVALMNNGRIEATVDSLGAEEAERYLGV